MRTLISASLTRLAAWARFAEQDWYALPDRSGLGCYGSGYNAWGVQTNQKYLAAMATLATHPATPSDVDRGWALDRALAALRFSLWSHHSGGGTCTDGSAWGHTWISPLGIERMMHGVHALRPHLSAADDAALRAMLVSEATWQHRNHERSGHRGVQGSPWNHTGRNNPESNLWVGALLWRTAAMYSDETDAAAWREEACRYLINAVSVGTDASDGAVVDGKPVCERFVGANFFPHFSLDHHGYTNVGYMVICTSNAAMLHFDLRALGLDAPQSLHHHQRDLWQVLRRMLFCDGRLARIGGDSRVRYAYCQEYLIPALLYAADHLGEAHAGTLLRGQLQCIDTEMAHNGDGSFYARRLAPLRQSNPYYYTRLESDRAVALSMLASYANLIDPARLTARDAAAFEASVSGSWCEPEHGAVLHRSPQRFASFAWRSWDIAQGLCLPPQESDLAEWRHNLVGAVRYVGEPRAEGDRTSREVLDHAVHPFDGGFLTAGRIREGARQVLAEGWQSERASAVHQLALAALPDGHTMLGLQFCRNGSARALLHTVKGLNLAVPNDLFNRLERRLRSAAGDMALHAPAEREHVEALGRWCHVDDQVGIVLLRGDGLMLHRTPHRRGGKFESLYVEEVCSPCRTQTHAADAGTVLIDTAWAVGSQVDADMTRAIADTPQQDATEGIRSATVVGCDRRTYRLLLAIDDAAASLPVDADWRDVVTGEAVPSPLVLQPNEARLLVRG